MGAAHTCIRSIRGIRTRSACALAACKMSARLFHLDSSPYRMAFPKAGGAEMSRTRVCVAAFAVIVLAVMTLPGSGQTTAAKASGDPVVALETTMGTIKVQLNAG